MYHFEKQTNSNRDYLLPLILHCLTYDLRWLGTKIFDYTDVR